MNIKYIIVALIILVILLVMIERTYPNLAEKISLLPTAKPVVLGNYTLGKRTKTKDCKIRGPLPDPDCTPGAVFTDKSLEDICKQGYTKTVRNVPGDLKHLVYEEYGITSHAPNEYEVDHLIPLEIGGSNDIANLFPEAAEPKPGFHEKDKVENYLHDQVCNGDINLQVAQTQIANDWVYTYQTIFDQ